MSNAGLRDVWGHFVDYSWTPRGMVLLFVAQSIYHQFIETIQSSYVLEASSLFNLIVTTMMTFLFHLSYLQLSEYTWTQLRDDILLLTIPPVFAIYKSKQLLKDEVSGQNQYVRGVFYGTIFLAGTFFFLLSIILIAILLTNPAGGLFFIALTITIGPLSYLGVVLGQIASPIFGKVVSGRFNRSVVLVFGIPVLVMLLF